jgi:hypothetical protein
MGAPLIEWPRAAGQAVNSQARLIFSKYPNELDGFGAAECGFA